MEVWEIDNPSRPSYLLLDLGESVDLQGLASNKHEVCTIVGNTIRIMDIRKDHTSNLIQSIDIGEDQRYGYKVSSVQLSDEFVLVEWDYYGGHASMVWERRTSSLVREYSGVGFVYDTLMVSMVGGTITVFDLWDDEDAALMWSANLGLRYKFSMCPRLGRIVASEDVEWSYDKRIIVYDVL